MGERKREGERKKKRDSTGNYSRFLFRNGKTEEVAVAGGAAAAMPIWLLLLRSIQIFKVSAWPPNRESGGGREERKCLF